MPDKIRRQFGLWDSLITPASMAGGNRLSNLGWSEDGALVWLESRLERNVLVVQPAGGQAPRDLNSEFSVRGRVGYGGGEFTLGRGYACFVDGASARIFRQPLAFGKAEPLTPAFGQAGAPVLSPDGRWLLFVHTYEGQDVLAVVDAAGLFWPQKLVSGDDFYMQPAWHPHGDRLAWIAWNHPNMPWDGTFLRLGRLNLSNARLPAVEDVITIAGDENTAIFQPEFSPDGASLAFVSDAGGWGQLYLYDLERGEQRQLTHAPAEHGTPAWVQGLRTYAFSPEGDLLYFLRNQAGSVSLWRIDLETGEEQRLSLEDGYTDLEQISLSPPGLPVQVALLASGVTTPIRLITFQPGDGVRIRRRATSEELPPDAYSTPQDLAWQGMDGGTVYGLFYPPHNHRFEGIGKPPLIARVHGGPTGQARRGFNMQAQFFTSRGYAFLEVNFRGSSGYGRAYQDALRGNWGVIDVQDVVSGARFLTAQGLVDETRLVILGGSSGGFTVLKALEDYPGFFKAGICLYGISNHFSLLAGMHKFEARYSDQLLGPLPEAAHLYKERSPIFFADRIQDPVALFQGEDDPVVPRSQSDEMVASLRQRGVPHIYHVYPGEGHGFRKPETIAHFYKTVDQFLQQYVIFSP